MISPGPLTRWTAAGSSQSPSAPPDLPNGPLTEWELEVLRLLCQAHSNAEIADIAGVAESTVKTHVSSLLSKLGVSSRIKAVVRGTNWAWSRTWHVGRSAQRYYKTAPSEEAGTSFC